MNRMELKKKELEVLRTRLVEKKCTLAQNYTEQSEFEILRDSNNKDMKKSPNVSTSQSDKRIPKRHTIDYELNNDIVGAFPDLINLAVRTFGEDNPNEIKTEETKSFNILRNLLKESIEKNEHIQVEFSLANAGAANTDTKKNRNLSKKKYTNAVKGQQGSLFGIFMNMMGLTVNELRKNPKLVKNNF